MSILKLFFPAALASLLIGCLASTPVVEVEYGQKQPDSNWSSESAMRFTWQENQLQTDSVQVRSILDYYQKNRQSATFQGAKDRLIHYDVFPAPQPKAALVIVPGNAEASIHYAETVYDLMQSHLGYSIYLINLRGQGFSQRLLGKATHLAQILHDPEAIKTYQKAHIDDFQYYIDDLHTFIETVVQPQSTPLILLGHSLGGLVVTRYLEQYPEQVKAAILSSPLYAMAGLLLKLSSGTLTKTVVNNRINAGEADAYMFGQVPYDPTMPYLVEGQVNPLTTSENRFHLKQFITQENPAIALGGKTWGWTHQVLNGIEKTAGEADRIRAPLLILQAGDDQIALASGNQTICTTVNQNVAQGRPAQCTLVNFANAQHDLLLEKDVIRSAVLDEIMAFLKRYD